MTTAREQMETAGAQTQVLNGALKWLLINLVSDPFQAFPTSTFPDPVPLLTLPQVPLHLLEGEWMRKDARNLAQTCYLQGSFFGTRHFKVYSAPTLSRDTRAPLAGAQDGTPTSIEKMLLKNQ